MTFKQPTWNEFYKNGEEEYKRGFLHGLIAVLAVLFIPMVLGLVLKFLL